MRATDGPNAAAIKSVRIRHRDYYLTLAKQSFPQGKDAPHELALLETEHDNLRAALAASFSDPASVEQMLESLKNISVHSAEFVAIIARRGQQPVGSAGGGRKGPHGGALCGFEFGGIGQYGAWQL